MPEYCRYTKTQTYCNDALSRLTSAAVTGGPANYNESYGYSAMTGNLESKGGWTLAYNDPDHVHAVTGAGGNTYGYDDNGNQVTRMIGGSTYTLGYDAENRLVEVQKNGLTMATFTYDGDGKRVKSVIGGETTLFVGGHYEVVNGSASKYYFAGAQRVAVRKNGALSFLIGDHLGSTSIAMDGSGNKISEIKYKAWGEVRYASGAWVTDYTYTGQYSNVDDFGLMFYGARWYDPYLNRFTSPDSIIPDNYNPLDWDRYQYTRSNPLIYTDPGGHNPLAVIFIIAICVATYLATPETAYAPEAGFISPTNVDQSSATKAYFDTAPGTGDISDIYTAATGRTLFSGEEVDLGGRIFAGAASALPVTASGLKQAGKLFDIVPYGVSKKIPGLVGHHGVMDVWATANIPGYKRYNPHAPTILLDPSHHQATIDTFNAWRKANTGSITGAIDWSNMSPKEIQKLAYSMFDAAGVPDEVRQEYFRQFYEYLYGGSEIIE